MSKSFSQRAKSALNPTGKRLLELMDEKRTNLCASLDVTAAEELLELADHLGPELCAVKIHVDILTDFTSRFPHQLQALADQHRFLIFEDRKFADIGNTVRLQYQEGVYRISDWADLVNAHPLPGPGVIEGLKSVGLEKGRGLLLIAQISSKGSLAKGEYTQTSVKWALEHEEFVVGFITQEKLTDHPSMIHFTPGVKIEEGSDALGQNYNTPHKAIFEKKSDVIIVGRGVYQAQDPVEEARKYREAGWSAYQQVLESEVKV